MLIKGQMPNTVNRKGSNSSAGEAAVLRLPKSLKLGKTIQGQVVSIKGNEIELLLQGKTRISARVDSEMSVSLNQILNFEVNKTSNSVMLRPLFENLAGDANVAKAIQAANLQMNGDNLNMVSKLMEQGLPVDKKSLQEMSRFMNTNSKATGNVLVEMKAFQIPLSNENINQFVSYKGMNHYLSDTMNDLSVSLNLGLKELSENNQQDTLKAVVSRLNQFFSEQSLSQTSDYVSSRDMNLNESSSNVMNISDQTQVDATRTQTNTVAYENNEIQINLEGKNFKVENSVKHISRDEITAKLQEEIQKLELPDSTKNELKSAKGNLQKTFQVFNSLVQSEVISKEINGIIKSDVFQNTIQALFEDGIFLKPEEFSDKESVKELYKSIKDQINTLLEVSEKMGKAGEEISHAANSAKNNLEFINQINQTYNYIQIPLKNGENTANGELFVYAKKKNSLAQDESVSALLHLDMKNLGTMDVRVQMTNEKVQTNFFLENEEAMNFISEHLSELDAAIERRGYQVQSMAQINEEKKDTIEHLIRKEESDGAILVSNHSFDARA